MNAWRSMFSRVAGRGAVQHAMVPVCAVLMLLCTAAAASGQSSNTLRVFVNHEAPNGIAPVAGATVCAGTTTEPAKYGRQTTNTGGQVYFYALPGSQVVVTVHKSGFVGQRKQVTTNGNDQFRLQPGSGGPTCPAASARPVVTGPLTPAIASTTITRFSINNGAAEVDRGQAVQLWVEWTGETPTEYRVSENAGFPGAVWQRWGPPRPVPGRTWRPTYLFQDQSPGEKTIYFQLRNVHGATSAIVSDRIRMRAGADIGARRVEYCRLEIHRANNALASEPDPALREVVQIPAGTVKRFNSVWPSPNEKRLGYGMHVRRLRNVGSRLIRGSSTPGAGTGWIDLFTLLPGEAINVRFDLDSVSCYL